MARITTLGKTTTAASTVAICGNPNSGKTTVFNAMTGLNQRVGNYPGVTVERVSGRFTVETNPSCQFVLVDVPGAYSLAAVSPDEYIAATTLFGSADGQPAPDAIICVMDATNLERSLYLLLQVIEIGRPVVVALNMFDVAERRGIRIDTGRLSSDLGGIPVIPVVGNRGRGIKELKEAVAEVVGAPRRSPQGRLYDDTTEALLRDLRACSGESYRSRAECLRIVFDEGGPAEERFIKECGLGARQLLDRGRAAIRASWSSLTAAETTPLTRRASELYRASVSQAPPQRPSLSDKADRVLLHPVLGPVIFFLIMLVMFQSIFSWAEPFMRFVDNLFSFLAVSVAPFLPEGPVRSLVTDGVIGGVGSVLIFVPQIAILFIFIALLEDSGYMVRAAFLVDRLFRWCGLSGKSFIPMLSSFACAVPGVMATRTIESRKLRLITIMVAPLMTCSARLPVYALMIAAFVPYRSYFGLLNLQGLVLAALYLLGILLMV